MQAKDFMSRKLATAAPDQPGAVLFNLFLETCQGGIPVLDQNRHLLGIVTSADLLRALFPGCVRFLDCTLYPERSLDPAAVLERINRIQVGEIMRRDLVTAPIDTPFCKLVALLMERKINQIPVVEAGRLQGMVTRFDVFRVLEEKYKEARAR
ncbi:MAG: CBS domain-containing protein [Firmicutes bacterium]|nr:CBS domain-containing protein [Bacillota bacterium]